MNIGLDIRPLMSPLRTGVGEYTFELLNAIFSLDQTNQYFLFYNSQKKISAYLPKWSGANIHYVQKAWPNKVFNASLKLFGRPKLDKFFPVPLDWFFSPNLNFTALSKNTKHLLTIHDLSFEWFPEFFTSKRRWWHKIINPKKQCQQADKIIVPSTNTKRDLVDRYKIPAEKITVIYHGLSSVFQQITDKQLEREKIKIRKKYFLPDNYILFLGTIEPRKNIAGMIQAFELIQSQLPQPYFLIIAGAPGWKNKKIYQQAEESAAHDRIKFIGYISPEDKPALYAAASLFVYPSFYEGFGFPVLEAMAMGVPIITSNRSSLPELSTTCLINPNRPSEMAQAIQNTLTNTAWRNLQIKNGRALAAKFSWQQAAAQWLALIN